jgi:hypothetical protein
MQTTKRHAGGVDQQEPKFQFLELDRLNPNRGNPRKHIVAQVRAIARSIETFGFNAPILIDKQGNIVAGHGRYEAAKLLGLERVPTILLEHLTETQAKAYALADNKLTDRSSWDDSALAVQLKELSELALDFDIEAIGFETPEIDFRIQSLDVISEDAADDFTVNTGPVVSRPGDLWLLGPHRLHAGSALDTAAYDTLLEGDKAAAAFRKLIVNAAEAKTVRHVFRRYTELKSVRALKADLDAQEIVSKVRRAADGTPYGAKPLARGALYLMLQNRIYRGEIVHKDKSYPGNHEAIIDEGLWSQVQSILRENRTDRILGTTEREASLLSGLLFDARGERLTPTFSTKNGVRYRYYVSRSLMTGTAKDQGQRIPALELEALVKRRLHGWLTDRFAMLHMVQNHTADTASQKQMISAWERAAASWPDLGPIKSARSWSQ